MLLVAFQFVSRAIDYFMSMISQSKVDEARLEGQSVAVSLNSFLRQGGKFTADSIAYCSLL